MASRRKLKKKIKEQTNLLIEDAFIESLNGDEKMDKVIDDLIDKRFDLLSKVSNYPLDKKGKEIKSHFNDLKKDLEKDITDFSKKIGSVG